MDTWFLNRGPPRGVRRSGIPASRMSYLPTPGPRMSLSFLGPRVSPIIWSEFTQKEIHE